MDNRRDVCPEGEQQDPRLRQGEPFIKKREVTFNPNSRKHIQYCLQQKYNWKPKGVYAIRRCQD